MGNSISISESAPNIDRDDLHVIGKTSTIRWGDVFEMINSKTDQKVLMQERFTQDSDIYVQYLEQCNDRLSLFHPNLAGLLGFSQSDAPDPATDRYSICLYFEHVAISLADLINARAAALNSSENRTPKKANLRQIYFSEPELMRFLSQLIDVLAYLQVSGINLGDITPDVCFVTETGNIKIIDKKFIFDDRLTTFDLINQGATQALATPGELKALENGFARCTENRYKADLFRVGMIMVECATLQSSYDIYDLRSQAINIEALSSRLIDIKARYSETFYNLVREMLRFDENRRLDFVALNQCIHDTVDPKLLEQVSPLPKFEEKPLRSSQVKARQTVEAPLSSKGNDISPSSRSPQQQTNVTRTLRDQHMQSMEKDRERDRKIDKRARRDDDNTDDTHEFDSDIKVNNVRFTQPRLSIGSSHHADTSYEMPHQLSKSTLPNFERVSYQELSRKTTPTNSSKKETPVKNTPDSLQKASSMRTTPSKLRIFDPIKSPKPPQNLGILSQTLGMHEQPRQTTPSKQSEEYGDKMYSPFNHRPSRSDITSSPTAKKQINYENLQNFPQLGRYTAGYNTPSAEKKPIVLPENRSGNKTNVPTSPEQFTQPPSHNVKGKPIQFSEASVQMTMPDSYRSIAPQPTVFSTAQTPIHTEPNRHHMEEQSPQWGYSNSLPPSFGNLEGSFNGSFNRTQPVQPVGFKEDRKVPNVVQKVKEESPRMSFAGSTLPKFGGQALAEEISPGFGVSVTQPQQKSPPKKFDIAKQIEEDNNLGVDDRFARAMMRSKRSEGFVKEMSRSQSKSPLRKE